MLHTARLENLNAEPGIPLLEGIWDWKEYEWIMHPKNVGVTSDIPKYLKHLIYDDAIYEHRCYYKDGKLINHEAVELEESFERRSVN